MFIGPALAVPRGPRLGSPLLGILLGEKEARTARRLSFDCLADGAYSIVGRDDDDGMKELAIEGVELSSDDGWSDGRAQDQRRIRAGHRRRPVARLR